MPMASSSRQLSTRVHVSSINNVSYNVDSSSGSDGAVKTILEGRKCWRQMKGRDEVVWPPELEAALIEGLENYRPAESRSTKGLGRFPMRNKFISDWIFTKTGKRRTAKQVGSRIQQLRDTNAGKHILKLLSDRHYEMMHPSRASRTASSSTTLPCKSEDVPTTTRLSPSLSPAPTTHIYIDVAVGDSTASSSQRVTYPLSSPSQNPSSPGVFHFSGPRPLKDIDPTVTFTYSYDTPLNSSFRVHRDGGLVHAEETMMQMRPAPSAPINSPESSSMYLHSTSLVPGFWDTLCETPDPTPYTISQEIIHRPDTAIAAPETDTVFSAIYHFCAPLLPTGPSVLPSIDVTDENGVFGYTVTDVVNDFLGVDNFTDSSGSQSPRSDDSDYYFAPSLSVDSSYLSLPTSPVEMSLSSSVPWSCSTAATLPMVTSHSFFESQLDMSSLLSPSGLENLSFNES